VLIEQLGRVEQRKSFNLLVNAPNRHVRFRRGNGEPPVDFVAEATLVNRWRVFT